MAGRRAGAWRVRRAGQRGRGAVARRRVGGGRGRVLAQRFGVSPRQARRYVDRAAGWAGRWCRRRTRCSRSSCRRRWSARVREQAAASGGTISALVAAGVGRVPGDGATRRAACAGERAGGRGRVRLRPPRGHGFVGGLRHSRAAAAGPRASGPARKETGSMTQRGDLRPGVLGPAEEGRDDRLADRGAARPRASSWGLRCPRSGCSRTRGTPGPPWSGPRWNGCATWSPGSASMWCCATRRTGWPASSPTRRC